MNLARLLAYRIPAVTSIDWLKLLHGEQGFAMPKPRRPGQMCLGETRVTGVLDKGAQRRDAVRAQGIARDA